MMRNKKMRIVNRVISLVLTGLLILGDGTMMETFAGAISDLNQITMDEMVDEVQTEEVQTEEVGIDEAPINEVLEEKVQTEELQTEELQTEEEMGHDLDVAIEETDPITDV
ncbi:hypothetical protein LJC58_01945, partial [Lachnospiraceae bacterium OttesenSCG-928-D06]|nr:hypothetical protein [Lachnospiraceae bacterium OttesenSCG-928-D06]